MSSLSESFSIVEPMHFSFTSEKVCEDLIITTISIKDEPVFMYPIETNDFEEAENIAKEAFVLMLKENYKKNVKRASMRKNCIEKTADNFFDELI